MAGLQARVQEFLCSPANIQQPENSVVAPCLPNLKLHAGDKFLIKTRGTEGREEAGTRREDRSEKDRKPDRQETR